MAKSTSPVSTSDFSHHNTVDGKADGLVTAGSAPSEEGNRLAVLLAMLTGTPERRQELVTLLEMFAVIEDPAARDMVTSIAALVSATDRQDYDAKGLLH